jgi:hypothetical protein
MTIAPEQGVGPLPFAGAVGGQPLVAGGGQVVDVLTTTQLPFVQRALLRHCARIESPYVQNMFSTAHAPPLGSVAGQLVAGGESMPPPSVPPPVPPP